MSLLRWGFITASLTFNGDYLKAMWLYCEEITLSCFLLLILLFSFNLMHLFALFTMTIQRNLLFIVFRLSKGDSAVLLQLFWSNKWKNRNLVNDATAYWFIWQYLILRSDTILARDYVQDYTLPEEAAFFCFLACLILWYLSICLNPDKIDTWAM